MKLQICATLVGALLLQGCVSAPTASGAGAVTQSNSAEAAAHAEACPSPLAPAISSHALDATQLEQGATFSVASGGDIQLERCNTTPGVGYVAHRPDFTFVLNGAENFEALQVSINGGRMNCDTTLLVHDGVRYRFTDDDSGLDPILRLSARSGTYRVWAGNYRRGVFCVGSLQIRGL